MPKSTVTVDTKNEFAYPSKETIVKANGLITQENIQTIVLPKLIFEGTDTQNKKYQVELSVSIIADGETLIPQVALGEPKAVGGKE